MVTRGIANPSNLGSNPGRGLHIDEHEKLADARFGNDDKGDSKIVYQIKSPASDPDGKHAWLEMIVEIGTAA